jgi:hypothetical protein
VAVSAVGLVNSSAYVEFHVCPPNDDFTNSTALTGSSLVVRRSLAGATLEPGESNAGVASIWGSWTAPRTGVFTCSSASPYDRNFSALAIYTGSSLGTLARIPDSSSSDGLYTNRVVFNASAGTTYHLAISCREFYASDVILSIASSAPPTVHITSPAKGTRILSGAPVAFSALAQDDTGLPVVDFYVDGRLVASLSNSPFTTPLQFFDEYNTTHRLALRATDLDGIDSWDFAHIETLPPPPANDDFAQRTPLDGFLVFAKGTTVGATLEPGESGFGSVWWSWTAPASGRAHLQSGYPGYPGFVILTGEILTSLTPIAATSETLASLAFDAVAGMTYQLRADAPSGTSDFTFSLYLDAGAAATLGPPNMLPNGALSLRLGTLVVGEWVLEGSTNLVDWIPVSTNLSRWNVIDFVDTRVPISPVMFYRAVGN